MKNTTFLEHPVPNFFSLDNNEKSGFNYDLKEAQTFRVSVLTAVMMFE